MDRFPDVKPRYFFIAVLAPSAVFWSSGILKDSFTYAAVCLVIPSLFSVIEGKFKFKSLYFILLGFYIIYELKPYILFAIIGGVGIGFFILFLRKLPKGFLRVVLAPALTVLLFITVMWGINIIGSSLGGIYSTPDKMLYELSKHHVLILFNDYAIAGTKIYDYLAVKRRILLCFTDDENALKLKNNCFPLKDNKQFNTSLQQEIIEKTQSGYSLKDTKDLEALLLNLHKELKTEKTIICHSVHVEDNQEKNKPSD